MAAGDRIQLVTLDELQAQVETLTAQVQTLLIAQGLPAGGTAGQILTKQTEQDYAATWMDPANGGVPAGGLVGQALIKASDQAQDVTWGNLPAGVPAGGTTGQVLKKLSENDGDTGWGDESGGGAKVVTGSYTGKGTHGETNKNTLTFASQPKFVFVIPSDVDAGTGGGHQHLSLVYGVTQTCAYALDYAQTGWVKVAWSGNTVSWYTESGHPYVQFNAQCVYRYIVIL